MVVGNTDWTSMEYLANLHCLDRSNLHRWHVKPAFHSEHLQDFVKYLCCNLLHAHEKFVILKHSRMHSNSGISPKILLAPIHRFPFLNPGPDPIFHWLQVLFFSLASSSTYLSARSTDPLAAPAAMFFAPPTAPSSLNCSAAPLPLGASCDWRTICLFPYVTIQRIVPTLPDCYYFRVNSRYIVLQ